MVLTDNCGRPLLNLRISITQRCNFRCDYCHKEGEGCSRGICEEMTVDDIVKGIAAIPGLKDLSLTTNGSLLASEAENLHACGLRRVNISLPTLNPEAYTKLTNGNLENTLDGVKAAVAVGFNPVKLNMVVLNGINVNDVPEMMDFARQTGTILQLIELDPVNVEEEYFAAYHRILDDYEEMLKM